AAAFASMAAALRRRGRLAFLCWQHDMHNELFAIPLRAFSAHVRMPGPAAGELFMDPRQVTGLLSGTGSEDSQIAPVREPARTGATPAPQDVLPSRYCRRSWAASSMALCRHSAARYWQAMMPMRWRRRKSP